MRRVGPPWLPGGEGANSTYFQSVNRGKRSLTLDFTKPDGIALLLRLIDGADVLIENYRTGTLAQYGLGYDDLHRRFGKVWHINCHSMKSVGNAMSTDEGARRPDFVLGDRDGKTCDPAFLKLVRDVLVGQGYTVAINDPYKGLELIMRYSDPAAGRHALQIEINRGLYMHEGRITKNAGFDELKEDLDQLLDAVVDFARRA